VWMIRAGDNAEAIDPMRRAGTIGLRYETVGDALEWTPAEIEKGVSKDPQAVGHAQLRTILLWFANDAKVGDLVVSPNPARREIWLGILTGDYGYSEQPTVAHFLHTRTIDWLGWLDRDAVWMRPQLKSIEVPAMMVELYSRDWWWNHVGTNEMSVSTRSSWSKTPVRKTKAAGASATPRKAAAAKVSTKPKVVAPVLCAGTCGLVWSPYVLVGGVCADCRLE
jgi:hypothetical protein